MDSSRTPTSSEDNPCLEMVPTELADYGPDGGRALWWLDYTKDPRVVLVECTRQVLADFENVPHYHVAALMSRLGARRRYVQIAQAQALLDAVAAYDTYPPHDVPEQWRARLVAAVTAIVGEQS